MVDYSQPYMPNALSNANALSTMNGLMEKQKQSDANLAATQAIGRGDYDAAEAAYRAAGLDQQAEATRAKSVNIKAGSAIAGGDYDAAAGIMLKHGYLDAGQKLSDKQRDDVDRTMQLGAQIAQIPGLKPEQWSAFMAEAKKDGFDTAKFEDPTTGPPLMAAYAGKVQDYNKTLSSRKEAADNTAERANRVIQGLEPWPIATRGDTEALAVQAKIRELDPTFNANRANYARSYVDPKGTVQKSLGAIETALHHAATLSDSIDNLSDTGWAPLTSAYHLLQRTGGNEALENYEATATAFSRELDKAFTGGVGAAGEREEASKRISSSKPKPALLSGNAANVELMVGKMLAFENQWQKVQGAHVKPPASLSDDERNIIREIFAKEPDATLRQQRFERLSHDPRTADLVAPPGESPSGGAEGSANPSARPAGMSDEEIRGWAHKAIEKNPALASKVRARMQEWGITP